MTVPSHRVRARENASRLSGFWMKEVTCHADVAVAGSRPCGFETSEISAIVLT
jgi:hypothetical protein